MALSREDYDRLPEQTSLPALPDVAFDRIASLVKNILGVPVALVSLVDKNKQAFPGSVGLPEPYQTDRETPLSHSFCQHVVAGEKPLVINDARQDELLSDSLAIPELGVVAYAGMPLVDFNGDVIGSLCAIDGEARKWTPDEVALLRDLAAACSAELQLREAVKFAAQSSDRWRTLSQLSEALSEVTSIQDISRTLSRLSIERLGAMYGGVVLLNSSTETMHFVDLGVFPQVVVERTEFSLWEDRPSALALRSRKPLFFETIDELAAVEPASREAALATKGNAFAYLPLLLRGDPIGTILIIWSEARAFSVEDRELLEGLGRYTAQAVHRAALLAERRDVAETLQSALLPSLPKVDWAEILGFYRASRMADAVGGDWFDAFTGLGHDAKGNDTMTIVVGDVNGHDTEAAAAMGQLQSGLRALALDEFRSPDVLLTRLDYVMNQTLAGRMATAIVATLTHTQSDELTLTWSNAGHIAPLLIAPGQPVAYLEREADLLLGFSFDSLRTAHSIILPSGSTVLLFTDGLIERSGKDLTDSMDALRQLVEENRDKDLEEMLKLLHDESAVETHDDDTVVLGIHIP